MGGRYTLFRYAFIGVRLGRKLSQDIQKERMGRRRFAQVCSPSGAERASPGHGTHKCFVMHKGVPYKVWTGRCTGARVPRAVNAQRSLKKHQCEVRHREPVSILDPLP